ncbi:MAG: hypothetical protein JO238_08715 [Alphaproteobacteria bacterium]|nr:hypothetical protein [Alphaproteobacteria bacterium]
MTLPAKAQDQGGRASTAAGASADAQGRGAEKRDERRNLAIASRMTDLPEFVDALRKGDAAAAKQIFVANGGSKDLVLLVPVPGWNPTTGYNASEPLPADSPNNPVVCQSWHLVPWGWNIQTQSYSGYIWACWGPGKNGLYGWAD